MSAFIGANEKHLPQQPVKAIRGGSLYLFCLVVGVCGCVCALYGGVCVEVCADVLCCVQVCGCASALLARPWLILQPTVA